MKLTKHLHSAKEAAKAAGRAIMTIYATDFSDSVEYKADQSPLTKADKAANSIIVAHLSHGFPESAMLSEERKDDSSRMLNDWCWVVDPLDGTKEFIKKNGEFTVNIALTYKGKSVLGVIYVPVTEVLYYAAEGVGAFREDEDGIHTIHVTDKRHGLTVASSRSHRSDKLNALLESHDQAIHQVVSAGSSLKGTMVAEGKADVYYRFGLTHEWDTAAMQCIVEQAGGIFKQMDGTPMAYNRTNTLNEKGFYAVNHSDNIWV